MNIHGDSKRKLIILEIEHTENFKLFESLVHPEAFTLYIINSHISTVR